MPLTAPALPDARARRRFLAAALHGLALLEARERTGRRFGAEADATWEGLRGHLKTGHRIHLLLRDAAVSSGAAFSAAEVFRLPGLANDEPFGGEWPELSNTEAEALWREVLEARPADDGPEGRRETFAKVTALLSADAAQASAESAQVGAATGQAAGLAELGPATRILVAGAGALRGLIERFLEDSELDWNGQVLVVAEGPEARHLGGLASVLLGSRGAARLVTPPSWAELSAPAEDPKAKAAKKGTKAGKGDTSAKADDMSLFAGAESDSDADSASGEAPASSPPEPPSPVAERALTALRAALSEAGFGQVDVAVSSGDASAAERALIDAALSSGARGVSL